MNTLYGKLKIIYIGDWQVVAMKRYLNGNNTTCINQVMVLTGIFQAGVESISSAHIWSS